MVILEQNVESIIVGRMAKSCLFVYIGIMYNIKMQRVICWHDWFIANERNCSREICIINPHYFIIKGK